MTNVIVRTTEDIIATLRPKQGIQCEENILYLFDPNVVVSITEATSRQWLEQQSEAYLNEYIKPVMDAYEEEKEREIDTYVEEKQSTIFFDNTNFTGTTTAETINVSGDFSADNITTNTLTVLSSATIPAPTTDNNPATKKYVDDAVASSTAGYHPDLFTHEWDDKLRDNVSWLRGDTFSWQSGNVYRRAFEHLADDLLMNRPYIIPVNGFSTKFFRNPENDTETQFAWTQGFSILYTDKDYPASGDPIYYIGSVADYVDEFAFGSGEYIITSLSADNKYYREADEDDSVNGYYAWMFNSSIKVYTTSATPAESDAIYTKSGGTYTSAGTVSSVLLGPASSTETVGGHTITYYTAEDGHKIVLASQESTVLDIYNSTGVAWYYIFDEENIRFKLPRKNPTREDLITLMRAKGNNITLGLWDGTKYGGVYQNASVGNASDTGDYGKSVGVTHAGVSAFTTNKTLGVTTDPTKSGIVIDPTDSDTVFTGNKYLYFYVGNFTQTALENTAGLNAELFNDKADTNLNNINPSATAKRTITEWGILDYDSVISVPFTTSWDTTGQTYTAPSDGEFYISNLSSHNPDTLELLVNDVFVCKTGDGSTTASWKIMNCRVKTGDIIKVRAESSSASHTAGEVTAKFFPLIGG